MVLAVKKLNFVYFYKITCPYCAMVNHYLIEPIELLDIARIEKVNISVEYSHKYLSLNERVSRLFGKGEPIAPLLYDVDNDIIFIPSGTEEESAGIVIYNFVIDVVEHLCKHVIVYDEVARRNRYLSPKDFSKEPRIFRLITAKIMRGAR